MSALLQQLTLDEVKLHFVHWRANKKRGSKIPETLWQKIRVLEQYYQPSRIRTALGISGSQYKKSIPPQKTPSTFIDISTKIKSAGLPQLPIHSSEVNEVMIDIHHSDGARLSFTHLNQDTIVHIIHHFLVR